MSREHRGCTKELEKGKLRAMHVETGNPDQLREELKLMGLGSTAEENIHLESGGDKAVADTGQLCSPRSKTNETH